MANEITINITGTVQWSTINYRESFKPGTLKFDQSTPESAAGTINLTSDTTKIPLDSVDQEAGWAFFNVVTTAMDVLIGPTSASFFGRLPPESAHCIHLTSDTTIMAQTTANSAVLQYLILQD